MISVRFWYFLVVASQNDVENPDFLDFLKNSCIIGALIDVSVSRATYVLPPGFHIASGSTELMPALAVARRFRVCCGAIFLFNEKVNSKTNGIRDFLIALHFAGVGAQMELPTGEVVVCIIGAVVAALLRSGRAHPGGLGPADGRACGESRDPGGSL